jgi:DNA processing protein
VTQLPLSLLDQLGVRRRYALWLREKADPLIACSRSVTAESRVATGYGRHVAGEMAADLGEWGWAVVSGGA